jgi:hypothetical protein
VSTIEQESRSICPASAAASSATVLSLVTLLSAACLLVLCFSLVLVAGDVNTSFNIAYNNSNAVGAIFGAAFFCLCAAVLSARPFSFGYFVGFYMLAISCGYVWLSYFTPLPYDHIAARWSTAISSAVFFLAATVTLNRGPRLPRFPSLSIAQMDALVKCLVGFVIVVALCGALTGLHFVGFTEGELIRSELSHPRWMDYATSISLSCLIPFSFAWLAQRRAYWTAALCIVLALSFYPIVVNKTALVAPFWLVFVFLLTKVIEPRVATILSLMLPLLIGLAAMTIDPSRPELVFRIINFRMLAIPSSGLDHYYHYFSTHPVTHFCQISPVGKLFSCAPPDQLGAMLAQEYSIGNFNASLLATEGIASVGVYLAPVAAALCGLLVSLGNLSSAGIAPSFVLLSSSMLVVMTMNVPLSVAMVTHGGIILFGLWLITPRAIDAG